VAKRNKISDYFDTRFQNEQLFSTQILDKNTISSRHLYPIFLNKQLQKNKESIFQELQKEGLGVQVHYKPIYQNSFYNKKFGEISLCGADNFYHSEISIPCNQTMSMEDAKYVADTILEVLCKYSSGK